MKKGNKSKFLINNSKSKKIKIFYKNWQGFNSNRSKNLLDPICKLLKIKVLILYKKNYLINSELLMKPSFKKMLKLTIKLRKMKTNLRNTTRKFNKYKKIK